MWYSGRTIFFALLSLWLPCICHAGKINIKYIQGRVVALCDIVIDGHALPAVVIVDLGLTNEAVLHESLAERAVLKPDSVILFDFYDSNVIKINSYALSDFNMHRVLGYYSEKELDNRLILGTIGLSALYQEAGDVILDIEQGFLAYGQPDTIDDCPYKINLHQPSNKYYIEFEPEHDYVLKSFFTTALYDTQIDSVCASIAGNDSGRFKYCNLGSFDISPFTAIRPTENFTLDYGYDAIVGNSFWQNFTVVFNAQRNYIGLREKAGRRTNLSDQDYFAAVIDKDYDRMFNWLENNTDSRYASEASLMLLDGAQDGDTVDSEMVSKVCTLLVRINNPELAAEQILYYLDKISDRQKFSQIAEKIFATLIRDIYSSPNMVVDRYQLEAKIGALLLDKGQPEKACEHLFPAVFNQPANAEINYQMGRYYITRKQTIRAWSRFMKAAVSEVGHLAAVAELNKLYNSPEFRQSFSMTEAREIFNTLKSPVLFPQLADSQWGKNESFLLEYFVYTDTEELAELSQAVSAIKKFYPDSAFAVACYYLSLPDISAFATEYGREVASDYRVSARPAMYINGRAYGLNRTELESASLIIDNLNSAKSRNAIPASQLNITPDTKGGWRISADPAVSDFASYEIILLENNVLCTRGSELIFVDNVCRGELGSGKHTDMIETTFSILEIQQKNKALIDSQAVAANRTFSWRSDIIDPAQCAVLVKYYDNNGAVCGLSYAGLIAKGGGL